MKTTKELAWDLGFLKKRSVSKSMFPATSNHPNCSKEQYFSYLIVLDFESTCWNDTKYKTQEIIEFPSVLLNTRTGIIESEFQHYVQPCEHPVLSDFCRQLTGITQEQVEQGIPVSLCLRMFQHWINQLKKEKGITFSDQDNKAEASLTAFLTWSDWDLGICLQNECQRKQISRPSMLNSWIDLRATYKTFYGRKPHGLNGALQDVGIKFEGREHSGLCDARNTAHLAWRMIKDSCVMSITKTMKLTSSGQLKMVNRSKKSEFSETFAEQNYLIPDRKEANSRILAKTLKVKSDKAETNTSVNETSKKENNQSSSILSNKKKKLSEETM